MEKEAEKIIKLAPERMKSMLESVYSYNSQFIKSKKEKSLLEKILFSMLITDRKFFAEDSSQAYLDNALPIGKGQTISQPSTVARMLLLLEPEPTDNILEIGAGSGWNACLLAFLSYPGYVISIDRIQSLIEKAKQNIESLKNNLKQTHPQDIEKLKLNLLAENIFKPGKITKRKYNKIIFTAGITSQENQIEEIAKNLLKQNGKLVCPCTEGSMLTLTKTGKTIKKEKTKEHYVFVPLLEGIER